MREVVKDRGRLEHILIAISNIEEFTKELTHPSIPWIVIEKMRHVLVHGYYTILPGKVWKTVQEDLPLLKQQIECLMVEE